jgi:hypothetical protein
MKLETTPIEYDQPEIDYKKFIESDLSPDMQVIESKWYVNRLAPDVNIKVKTNN